MTRRQRRTLLAAILGSGVVTIDASIVNVALPAIERGRQLVGVPLPAVEQYGQDAPSAHVPPRPVPADS